MTTSDIFVYPKPSAFSRRVVIDPEGRRIFLDVGWSWSKGKEARIYRANAYDNNMFERWTTNVFPHQSMGTCSFASAGHPSVILQYLGLSKADADDVIKTWEAQGEWQASGESQYSLASEKAGWLGDKPVEPERIEFHATHGLAMEVKHPVGCHKSAVEVAYDETCNRYLLNFVTVWSEGEDPVVTSINTHPQKLEGLAAALFAIMHERERFRLPDAAKGEKA